MKIVCLPLFVALAAAPMFASAQVSAAASAPVATPPAAALTKRDPRILSPQQKRENATAGTELRPAVRTTPQVDIPLGKTPPPPTGKADGPVPPSGVDDSAARCEAQANKRARTACLNKLKLAPG